MVPQMFLKQLEHGDIPQLRRCISSVQNHASCALRTQDGKNLKSISWNWAASLALLADMWNSDSQTPPRMLGVDSMGSSSICLKQGLQGEFPGWELPEWFWGSAVQSRLDQPQPAHWGWTSEAALQSWLCCPGCPVPCCAMLGNVGACCRNAGLTSGCCPNPCLVGRQILFI